MKPRFIKLFLALFLPFASFLLLAHFLFYYNNKYENNPVYPMGGVMFCSDADLSGDSVIFLAHQWNFFPGKQYTPSDFNEKSVTGGTFLTLGSFGNFSLGSTSEASNGTATYRLTLDIFFISAGNFFRLHTLPKRGKSLLAGKSRPGAL